VLRRTPASEPRVVGGIEQESGAIPRLHHLAGKDDLVAKLKADLADDRQLQGLRPRPGIEVDVAGRQSRQPERLQDAAHRQIFAIGDKMRLVVAREDAAAPVHREDAVGAARQILAID